MSALGYRYHASQTGIWARRLSGHRRTRSARRPIAGHATTKHPHFFLQPRREAKHSQPMESNRRRRRREWYRANPWASSNPERTTSFGRSVCHTSSRPVNDCLVNCMRVLSGPVEKEARVTEGFGHRPCLGSSCLRTCQRRSSSSWLKVRKSSCVYFVCC